MILFENKNDIKKTVCPGKFTSTYGDGLRTSDLFIDIQWENNSLSIVGRLRGTGNMAFLSGDLSSLLGDISHLSSGWTVDMVNNLRWIWQYYGNYHMETEEQYKLVLDHFGTTNVSIGDKTEFLKSIGKFEGFGLNYFKPSQEVLDFLQNLPDKSTKKVRKQ